VVKIRVYGLTKLGKKIATTKDGSDETMRVLQFLRENRTGTSDELEIVGGESYILKRLKKEGLVRELTTG